MLARRTRSVAAALVVVFAALASRGLARADASPPSGDEVQRADALKKQGDALIDDGKYADAYALYAQAYAINADPALLYNEASALKGVGEYPEALAKLDLFVKTAPPEIRAKVPAIDDLIADLRARVATLIVRSNVAGARVLVRDRFVGVVDAETSISLRAGPASVEVNADGYEPFKETVDLPAKGTVTVVATLLEKRVAAILRVQARPEGTLVLVDDKPLGPVPVEAHLAPGQHTILLRHAGYEDASVPLGLAAGEHRDVDLALHEPPPIYAKWWFWAGVGAVVVTGVVVTYALVTEKSPGNGSFSPGQVRGPLTLSF